MTQAFCLPLDLRIHQGFWHLRKEQDCQETPETLATALVHMAQDFALEHSLPCILILDAFFSVAPVFKLAELVWSVMLKAPLVTILVRAKKNYVAYFPAQQPDIIESVFV